MIRATYAKDKKDESVYNIRVAGAGCEGLEGQSIDVSKNAGGERREVLGRQIWAGLDRDGQPCALYAKGKIGVPPPRQAPSDLEKRVWTLEQTVARLVAHLQGPEAPPHGDEDAPPPGDAHEPTWAKLVGKVCEYSDSGFTACMTAKSECRGIGPHGYMDSRGTWYRFARLAR